ncbi:MAG: hypothetical protein ACT452_21090 [Microthrixaceae bacterium]
MATTKIPGTLYARHLRIRLQQHEGPRNQTAAHERHEADHSHPSPTRIPLARHRLFALALGSPGRLCIGRGLCLI